MDDRIGRVISGRYRVDSFLGEGGMARVYKVWDQMRSVHLAVKILNADLAADHRFLNRFHAEAGILASLQHPNIVRFYSLEQDGPFTFIVMDYVPGSTLSAEIRSSQGPLPPKRILQLMRQVCGALGYAHKLGYVHCDVKPANIMTGPGGSALVSDFGIARLAARALTDSGQGGTPAYMAPEQILGKVPTPSIDIYALGVILYEMLTGGQRPFTGRSGQGNGSKADRIRWEQMHLLPPSPRQYNPAISLELESVVLRCLEKEAGRRFPDVESLYRALEPPLLETTSWSRDESTLRPSAPAVGMEKGLSGAREQNRRPRNVCVGLLIGVPLILLMVFLAVRGGGPPGPVPFHYATSYLASTPFYASTLPSTPFYAPTVTSTPLYTPAYSPTPVWSVYNDSINGFSIEYPPGWVYQEDNKISGMIDFVSSSSLLPVNDFPSSGSDLGVVRMKIADTFPQDSQPYSPSVLLNQEVSKLFKTIPAIQGVNSMSIDFLPAASRLYRVSSLSGSPTVLDATLILDGDYFYLTLSVAPQSEWQTYQPVLERMTHSLKSGISSSP